MATVALMVVIVVVRRWWSQEIKGEEELLEEEGPESTGRTESTGPARHTCGNT